MKRLAGMLAGGVKITTYNTTVSSGYYTGWNVSVPVYYNTTWGVNTTYSQNTTDAGSRQTYKQTSVRFGPVNEPQWTYYDTYWDTSWNSTWLTSWNVVTSYSQQTYYNSSRYTQHYTDTSYSQQTWRETTW